ncbi:MAG: radical SAM family heme chaperone HemW [Clostridia bacterium]|nr:radical SAM family heme chaperone HemW [Clostridia bacterium]
MRSLGLYIHIPFCLKKCNYCDFYSLPCTQGAQISEYTDALLLHLKTQSHLYTDCVFDTVFLGGGTPSLLSCDDISKLFSALRENLNIADDAEISTEANPGTLDKEKLKTLKDVGVNRLSIGLQSSFDSDLKRLGRVHTLSDFEKIYSLARSVGFDNINIDIMYALPYQTKSDFLKTLDYVVEKSPEHISSYCLKIERGTPFFKTVDESSLPSEDTQYEMYLDMCDFLAKNGYEQYEISNFAKQGKRCRHNMKYWLSEEYVSLGPSAHSYFNGVRYSYLPNLSDYVSIIKRGAMPKALTEESVTMSENEKRDEYVMLKMRLCDGLCENEFKSRFKNDFISTYPSIEKYIKSGHITHRNGNFSFTPKGFFVSNYILSDILFNN